jgi:hypothetical protein
MNHRPAQLRSGLLQLVDCALVGKLPGDIARDLHDLAFRIAVHGTMLSPSCLNRVRYSRESGVFQPKCQMALWGCVGGGVFTLLNST